MRIKPHSRSLYFSYSPLFKGGWGGSKHHTANFNSNTAYPSRLIALLISCSFLLFLGGCQSKQVTPGIPVQVQQVVSGQTIEVLDTTQQPALIVRVRLIGIEAPDLRQQPWGNAAKTRIEQLIGETRGQQLVLQSVFLEPDVQTKDSFGRWLAYVWHDGVMLNEQLIKEGYVLATPRSPNNKYNERLIRAQEYARIMGYGIWSPEQPLRLTPAEFRRRNP
ncbi:MAG: thermonuclease family protein [Coleofasciculus sp. A1-SPW-01]|uniref:thermonuclease family protein n=1 Tax=Coleofasciculus sp. A1-SPW-01 TaxID=3070819 RepID=UPI0032F640F1